MGKFHALSYSSGCGDELMSAESTIFHDVIVTLTQRRCFRQSHHDFVRPPMSCVQLSVKSFLPVVMRTKFVEIVRVEYGGGGGHRAIENSCSEIMLIAGMKKDMRSTHTTTSTSTAKPIRGLKVWRNAYKNITQGVGVRRRCFKHL